MITFIYLIIINLKRMIIGSMEPISVTSASRSTRSRRNLAFNLLLCICRVVHRYQHTIPSWRQAKWHAYNPHLDLQLAGMTTTTMHLSAPMSAPGQYTTDFLWWQCIKTWHMMRDSKLSKKNELSFLYLCPQSDCTTIILQLNCRSTRVCWNSLNF
jgi:hypothetical protein